MASCPNCGRTKIPKRKGQPRSCTRCGVLPGPSGVLMRHGGARQSIQEKSA